MKKLICIILSIVFITGTLCVNTAFASSGEADNNIIFLNSLGLTKLDAYDGQAKLTRSQLAYIMACLSMGGDLATKNISNDSLYDDVSLDDNIYAPYIYAAYSNGILNGTGTNKFDPDGKVSTITFSVAGLRTLGCAFGKFDGIDYEQIASQLLLFKNIRVADTTGITVSEAAEAVKKLLLCNTYGVRFESYYIEDINLLEKKFKLYHNDGILLTGKTAGSTDHSVMVNNVLYEKANSTNYDEYNGYKVRAYINKADNKLAFVDAYNFENNVFWVEADDIVSVEGNSLNYINRNDKTQSIDLTSVTEVYNGIAVDLNYDDFNIKNGNIKFIGRDGIYSTALINSYETIVIGAIIDNTVYDCHKSTLKHTFSSGKNVHFYYDGNEITIEDLKTNDVLSIAYSKDESLCNVYVSRKVVSGTVSEVNDDYFVVDRKEYYRTGYFVKYEKEPVLGDNVNMAIDHFGRVAALLDASLTREKYGYLIDAATDSGIYNETKIKVYNNDDGVVVLNLADTVKANGYSVKNPKVNENGSDAFNIALYTQVEKSGNDLVYTTRKSVVRQMIKYRCNGKGEVIFIDTARKEPYEDETSLTISGTFTDITYDGDALQFEKTYGFTEGSAAFSVPDSDGNTFDANGYADEILRSGIDDEDYRDAVYGVTHDKRYSGIAYDVSDGGIAKAMVVDSPGGRPKFSATGTKAIFVISKVYETMAEDNDTSYKIQGYYGTQEASYVVAKGEYFKKYSNIQGQTDNSTEYEIGDVLQIELNDRNEIIDFAWRYNSTAGHEEVGYAEACEGVAGKVYSKDDDGFILHDAIEAGGVKAGNIIVSVNALRNVIVVDKERKKVTIGTYEDVLAEKNVGSDASWVYVRMRYNCPETIVVYR